MCVCLCACACARARVCQVREWMKLGKLTDADPLEEVEDGDKLEELPGLDKRVSRELNEADLKNKPPKRLTCMERLKQWRDKLQEWERNAQARLDQLQNDAIAKFEKMSSDRRKQQQAAAYGLGVDDMHADGDGDDAPLWDLLREVKKPPDWTFGDDAQAPHYTHCKYWKTATTLLSQVYMRQNLCVLKAQHCDSVDTHTMLIPVLILTGAASVASAISTSPLVDKSGRHWALSVTIIGIVIVLMNRLRVSPLNGNLGAKAETSRTAAWQYRKLATKLEQRLREHREVMLDVSLERRHGVKAVEEEKRQLIAVFYREIEAVQNEEKRREADSTLTHDPYDLQTHGWLEKGLIQPGAWDQPEHFLMLYGEEEQPDRLPEDEEEGGGTDLSGAGAAPKAGTKANKPARPPSRREKLKAMKLVAPWSAAVIDSLYLDDPFERLAHALRLKKGRRHDEKETKLAMKQMKQERKLNKRK